MQSTGLIERFSSININSDCDDDWFLEHAKASIMSYWNLEKDVESFKVELENKRSHYKPNSIKKKQQAELENQQNDMRLRSLYQELDSFKRDLLPFARKLNIRLGENPLLVQEQK